MERPVSTYSVVARDPASGQLGVAVQSHWFSVGSVVTWAEPGVGAVATQAFARAEYGPELLADLRAGASASEFVAQNASRLLQCLPATGTDLPPLAAQLGLDVERG